MGCERCRDLQLRYEIRFPSELTEAIRVVRANLDDGTIAQVPSATVGSSTEPFESLNENGPWPDVLEYEFECTSCGARFTLGVEVYHGAGGEWCPVEAITV
jgi:hypothetical protein